MGKHKILNDIQGRIFVVGDVHGCAHELGVMLDFLVGKHLASDDHILFIGDYIDRGPDSRSVLDSLLALNEFVGPQLTFLKGNHEDMLLSYLGDGGSSGDVFLQNGGDATLESYGFNAGMSAKSIRAEFPAEHLTFLMELQSSASSKECIFVHAGLNPLRGFDEQLESDLLWIRQGFIDSPHQFGKTVIFGHTPFEDILIDLPYKIGIDTGCVFLNALTCYEVTQQQVYQVKNGENRVRVQSLSRKLHALNNNAAQQITSLVR